MSQIRFEDIDAATPSRESLSARYAVIEALLGRPGTSGHAEALEEWDRLRREYETWSSLVHLRFSQDTTDEEVRAAREYADALAPVATEHEVAVKRRLLAEPDRRALERLAGAHALRLWETDITTF